MFKKTSANGGGNGRSFDDGVNDGVLKVIHGEDAEHNLLYVKILYMKNGAVVEKQHGKAIGTTIIETEFKLDYPNEYITAVVGTHSNDIQLVHKRAAVSRLLDRLDQFKATEPIPEDEYLRSLTHNTSIPVHTNKVSELQFKTSYGRRSWRSGHPGPNSVPFVLNGENGTKLVGLHGRSDDLLDAIGAYFHVVSHAVKHLEPQGGGSEEDSWDDGAYDCLRKVCVGEDGDCVSSVEFHYLQGNHLITHRHGKDSKERKEFVLNDHNEYVKSVEGTIHEDGFISSLTFRTSMNRRSEQFGKPVGTRFVLEAQGFHKVVGFRGRSRFDRLNALGAHLAVVVAPPLKKLEANGGHKGVHEGINKDYCRVILSGDLGNEWDDGIHDDIRTITVTYDEKSVKSVKFEYNGPVSGDVHGDIRGDYERKEFKLHSTNEYITSLVGHYGQKLPPSKSPSQPCLPIAYLTMLTFTTNRATYEVLKHSPGDTYVGISFKLEEKGHKIVGFHGKTEVSLSQIGVYLKPL